MPTQQNNIQSMRLCHFQSQKTVRLTMTKNSINWFVLNKNKSVLVISFAFQLWTSTSKFNLFIRATQGYFEEK